MRTQWRTEEKQRGCDSIPASVSGQRGYSWVDVFIVSPNVRCPWVSETVLGPRRLYSLGPGLDQVGEGQPSVNTDEFRVVRGFGGIHLGCCQLLPRNDQ
jgi:hypothetical protein